MSEHRIHKHPILKIPEREALEFTWQGKKFQALTGEMISSALFANGIRVFGHHPKDGTPQGIFCVNGQCSQCLVLADGRPVKACMTQIAAGMKVEPLDCLPELPRVSSVSGIKPIPNLDVPVLIIGGGPAGLAAAVELGKKNIRALLIDDKHRLGGKLILQTHKFFGSLSTVYAGTRGIDIATRLEGDVRKFDCIQIRLDTTALAVFSDHKVGILTPDGYKIVKPQVLLVAAGAREKSLAFRGNTLPGVYGAGAFQTLVNRDLLRSSNRLFIIGGGNVGLIAGYHALQAGINVVGLAEALPECSGYKVHWDKLVRMGVPIYTSHTIVSANGEHQVESVTIGRADEKFAVIPGTEKSFACDTILIAVGLDPIDEFARKAKEYGMKVFSAGDAEEIAEASAAMILGKIRGLEVAQALGDEVGMIPDEWYRTVDVLKSKPGKTVTKNESRQEEGVFPVLHCVQEIPCDPCTSVCPKQLIYINLIDIREIPHYVGDGGNVECTGCEKCVVICPALAVTLVDYRKDRENPVITIPHEFLSGSIKVGDRVRVMDMEGDILGEVEVTGVRALARNDRTVLVKVKAPREYAQKIAGILIQEPGVGRAVEKNIARLADDTIICRCERVTAGELRELIRRGYRDFNEIKAVTRAGMGACGGKTCAPLIWRLFREEGVPLEEITPNVLRPLFMEVPLGVFAGMEEGSHE